MIMRFLYDESFEEIDEDLGVPANKARAIYEEIRDRAGSEYFTKLSACAADLERRYEPDHKYSLSNSVTTFPLLKLPPAVRDQIYRHVLGDQFVHIGCPEVGAMEAPTNQSHGTKERA
ncbi:MAG: hypothetical protein Q9175_000552 [Cornicularia normoerica]